MPEFKEIGRKRILKSFFRRLRRPYTLQLNDSENTDEIFHFKLTKLNLYALASALLIGSFLIFGLLFSFTSLRYYIPGYETNSARKKMLALNRRVDSLFEETKGRDLYLQNMMNVITENEDFLLDTTALSGYALDKADYLNLSEIDKAGRYAYLKRSKRKSDTVSSKKKSKVQVAAVNRKKVKKKQFKEKSTEPLAQKDTVINEQKEAHPNKIKKRDTIIIMK